MIEITEELLKEVKDYCGETGTDSDTTIIIPLINAADLYLQGAIGEDYPTDNDKALTILKIVVNDLFNHRQYNESQKVSSATRKLVDSFEFQLRMEMIP